MIKSLAVIFLAASLSGCAANYFLDGKKYNDEVSFQNAVESQRSNGVNQVTQLPAPLTKKKLIAALPSEETLYAENARRHAASTGTPLTGIGLEQNRNMSKFAYKLTKVFYEGLQKRGIYPEVTIKDMPSMAISLEPSAEYDVIYMTEPSVGSGQYFYASVKHGKQVFAYDRSSVGIDAKVNAFIDAAQALAIRE